MTIVIEDNEEIPCSHCAQLRKSFLMIAVSAVLPMIFFAGLLLLSTAGMMAKDRSVQSATTTIVELIFGLLYVQLMVATSIMIVSYVKRKEPVLKYHYWYILLHAAIMSTYMCACFVMTAINESYAMSLVVLLGGGAYVVAVLKFLNANRSIWRSLRRVY